MIAQTAQLPYAAYHCSGRILVHIAHDRVGQAVVHVECCDCRRILRVRILVAAIERNIAAQGLRPARIM